MTMLAQIRRSLKQARASIPEAPAERGLNSEEMIRTVQALLAEVEATPVAEPQPFNPADYSPEDAALIERMEHMQKTMVWSDRQGCFIQPGSEESRR